MKGMPRCESLAYPFLPYHKEKAKKFVKDIFISNKFAYFCTQKEMYHDNEISICFNIFIIYMFNDLFSRL